MCSYNQKARVAIVDKMSQGQEAVSDREVRLRRRRERYADMNLSTICKIIFYNDFKSITP